MPWIETGGLVNGYYSGVQFIVWGSETYFNMRFAVLQKINS
jgi:hypothetical protein